MKTKKSIVIIFSMLLSSILFATGNSAAKTAPTVKDDNIIHINNETQFSKELKNKPVCLVDFYADWCGPCKMLTPTIKEIAKEYKGKVSVIKVNVDNNKELAQKYQIRGIPNVKIFKNGSVSEDIIGFRQKEVYKDALDKLLNNSKK